MNVTFPWYRKKTFYRAKKFASKESHLDILIACPPMTVHSKHGLQGQQTMIWVLKH